MTSKKDNKTHCNKTRKIKAGQTFSSDKPVQLFYENTLINCEVCKENIIQKIQVHLVNPKYVQD